MSMEVWDKRKRDVHLQSKGLPYKGRLNNNNKHDL